MKLATFSPPASRAPVAGEVRDGRAVAFSDGAPVLERLSNGDRTPADGEDWALEEVTLLAPVPEPRAIYGIGLNYAAHAAETGAQRPDAPIVFSMVPTSSAPPGAPVRCPEVVHRLDYEGELVAVMGAGGDIGGYAVGDDVSGRDLQRRESQWARAKGADGFCPWGPWITTVDEVADPHALRLQTWVNGELRQDASTADMLFRVDELVAFLAETCTLRPGDLIFTGTPEGVGMALDPPRFLSSADVVRIEIDGLGAIEHPVA